LSWRFCHFKFTLFSKNLLQAITNTKTKIMQRIYNSKKIGLQANKFNMATKIKMAANLEFLLRFNIVLILYFMRLHSLKHEKRKNCLNFKMAPESKMDAKLCFRHIVYRISSFSERYFAFLIFYYC
jgi:hypothetical protein